MPDIYDKVLIVDLLRRVLSQPGDREELLVEFERALSRFGYLQVSEAEEDVLRDLLLDLSFYEPDPRIQFQDVS